MEQSSKRKRSQNTTNEQYELYLEAMENDYVLRSGTIDPTLEDDYINKKWQDLTNKLNSIGQGPALPKDTWKKRFKDWKNATRLKFRKMKENQTATGGGVGTKIILTPLEERGLEVWGKVAVTGTPLVQCVGGLGHMVPSLLSSKNETLPDHTEGELGKENVDFQNLESEQRYSVPSTSQRNNSPVDDCGGVFYLPIGKTPTKKEFKKNEPSNKKVRTPQSLNTVAEELKATYQETSNIYQHISDNFSQFIKVYEKVNNVRNDIEARKLAFEIAKFKFENPTFQFNDN